LDEGSDNQAMDDTAILRAIQADERYQTNLDWGEPRAGHAEGSVRNHIADLERNLLRLRHRLSDDQAARLRLIIHTHDTFKAQAKRGVPIRDPRSHASLARSFLAEFCNNEDLLAMVQWHDEPYALWQRWRQRFQIDEQRLQQLLNAIEGWDLFLAFQIIDGCTASKSREPLRWFFAVIADRVPSRLTVDDLL
jgi:hypothetical protein